MVRGVYRCAVYSVSHLFSTVPLHIVLAAFFTPYLKRHIVYAALCIRRFCAYRKLAFRLLRRCRHLFDYRPYRVKVRCKDAYSHLGKIYARRGDRVRRGDIIAQSGNTGLSLAPHLHYEIRHNGMRVDPIHYFFMELDYEEYQKIVKIAQTGMQSFD